MYYDYRGARAAVAAMERLLAGKLEIYACRTCLGQSKFSSKDRKYRIMKIAVIGTGYVGLVQGTCLAESGNDVVCVDKIAAKIEGLNNGQVPIYEPGLAELVHRNQRDGRLQFTTELAEGIAEAEIIFIAVGTPQGDQGGADLSGVWEVGRQIAANLHSPKIIVIKSTVPVGTNAELARRMRRQPRYLSTWVVTLSFSRKERQSMTSTSPIESSLVFVARKSPNGCTRYTPHSYVPIGRF